MSIKPTSDTLPPVAVAAARAFDQIVDKHVMDKALSNGGLADALSGLKGVSFGGDVSPTTDKAASVAKVAGHDAPERGGIA